MADEKKNIVTPILIGALVIAAFFIGVLFSKVQTMEKGDQGTDQKQAAANLEVGNEAAIPTPSIGEVIPVTAEDHIIGNLNAPVTIIEYSDFECPFCSRFHETMHQVMDEYGDQVAWVYRHFPLAFHANAQKEAEASECVAELGGNDIFWKYIDAIYERSAGNGSGFSLEQLQPLAVEVGVDGYVFQTCLDSDKYAQKVKDDFAAGQAAGVEGTPGNILITADGQQELIPGAYPIDQLKPIIDKYLD
jgi:protein-disulfide isomerase